MEIIEVSGITESGFLSIGVTAAVLREQGTVSVVSEE